jgi:hypothetical protein
MLFHIFLCKAVIHFEMMIIKKSIKRGISIKEYCGMTIITEKVLIDEEDLLW